MKIKINDHLTSAYPELISTFNVLDPIELPNNQSIPVAEAITRIIIGQMLSRNAAQSIYNRVEKKREEKKLKGSWQLNIDDLVYQGVSASKTKAIKEFGKEYDKNPKTFESWRYLQYEEIKDNVSKYWGLSTWSADMLSIFYFGLPDVFPTGDGTIKRAIQHINLELFEEKNFDPNKAKPYRTYLSLYLWKMIDQKIFDI